MGSPTSRSLHKDHCRFAAPFLGTAGTRAVQSVRANRRRPDKVRRSDLCGCRRLRKSAEAPTRAHPARVLRVCRRTQRRFSSATRSRAPRDRMGCRAVVLTPPERRLGAQESRTIKLRPVISPGRGRPMRSRTVGARSARLPSRRRRPMASLAIQKIGTGLVV